MQISGSRQDRTHSSPLITASRTRPWPSLREKSPGMPSTTSMPSSSSCSRRLALRRGSSRTGLRTKTQSRVQGQLEGGRRSDALGGGNVATQNVVRILAQRAPSNARRYPAEHRQQRDLHAEGWRDTARKLHAPLSPVELPTDTRIQKGVLPLPSTTNPGTPHALPKAPPLRRATPAEVPRP